MNTVVEYDVKIVVEKKNKTKKCTCHAVRVSTTQTTIFKRIPIEIENEWKHLAATTTSYYNRNWNNDNNNIKCENNNKYNGTNRKKKCNTITNATEKSALLRSNKRQLDQLTTAANNTYVCMCVWNMVWTPMLYVHLCCNTLVGSNTCVWCVIGRRVVICVRIIPSKGLNWFYMCKLHTRKETTLGSNFAQTKSHTW